MSHDQRLEEEVQRQVAIAMSQQQQAQMVPPEPNVRADHLSQRKSNCACTDVAVVEPTGIQATVEAAALQRFPVDEITQRIPCDLQTAIKNLMFTIAYSTTMPTQPGDVYHGQQIPADIQELEWSRCARVGRRSSLIFLEAMGRGY